VKLLLPAGWPVLHTPLPAATTAHTFTAPDFDTLVDSPILAGKLQMDRFAVDGVDHYLVTLGGENAWDNARVARHLEQLVLAQRDFWGDLPYREPYYFFNLLTIGRGGSSIKPEHRHHRRPLEFAHPQRHQFLALAGQPRVFPRVERQAPAARSNSVRSSTNTRPTRKSLWIVEGITSYYQHVLLRRAGFYHPRSIPEHRGRSHRFH
jgi:predicted metalloprotease with PDZ domain